MTPERLAEIKERAEAASPEPWFADHDSRFIGTEAESMKLEADWIVEGECTNCGRNEWGVMRKRDEERSRQDQKWGVQRHPNEHWLAILMEEVGEAAEAVLENGTDRNLENEVIQIAAVAVAWLQDLDRVKS